MAQQQAPSMTDATQRFFQYFQLEATALQEQMTRLEDVPTIGGERMDAINHCLAGISRLQREVQDAVSYTTAYDQRMYSEGIKALFEKLDQVKATLAPKTKFSFKSSLKKNSSAISLDDAAELAKQQHARLLTRQAGHDSSESSGTATPAETSAPAAAASSRQGETPRRGSLGNFLKAAGIEPSDIPSASGKSAAVRKMSFASAKSVTINSHSNVYIILPQSAAHATSSGSLTNLRRCVIDMSIPTATGQPFAGLTIKDVKHSLLICGNVSGAAHVTKVEDSVILVATRQFRMHECHNCSVYLHANSRPVIEDCTGVGFAPLPEKYFQQADHMVSDNQWDQIQDFNWPRATQSPNWKRIERSKLIPHQIWEAVASASPSWSLVDILKAVGVSEHPTEHDAVA